jgi:hypothetical protein
MERHATVIAYYERSKPAALGEFLTDVQHRLRRHLADTFRPRPIDEVHATIIGLDAFGALTSGDEFSEIRKPSTDRPDIAGLCEYLASEVESRSMTMQIGGFANADLVITSLGARLWQRTLSAYDDKVVLMGWPVDHQGSPNNSLDALRRGAQRFGFVHRYHKRVSDTDPDMYMVIGNVDQVDAVVLDALIPMRAELEQHSCRVPLSVESIRIAVFDDTRLPIDTTRTEPLAEFLR